jgi:Zn-dependent peptidase ImmA (M78 family)
MEILAGSIAWAKQFPLSDMVKKRWIPAKSTVEEMTSELLDFFGFSNHTSWENYYFKQQLKVKFRISLSRVSDPYSISAWLRKGELQASELPSIPYNEKLFKSLLPQIRNIMANHPSDFFAQLQQLCISAGVKVVHTPCINKAPINGSTRWLNDTPLIQLSGRYKRNDIFWFTFFHEAGHILLHGKKDIFLENIDYSEKDRLKEHEADEFAIKWTLSREEYSEILLHNKITENVVAECAQKYNTHPAIILGRLQHDRIIRYSLGQYLIERIELV